MELKDGIKQINQSVSQSSASDATLEGYMLELKDANGNLVDKQPVSKLESLVYNYLTTKRQSELATAVGGMKFIKTLLPSEDLNDKKTVGVYRIVGTQHPSNVPPQLLSTTSAIVKVSASDSIIKQEIYPINGNPFYRIFYQDGNKWYDWQMINTNFPSYLKDYPDIASLAGGVNTQNDIKHGEFTGSQITIQNAKGLLVVKNSGTSTILVAVVSANKVTNLTDSPYMSAQMNGYELTIDIEEQLELNNTTYTII